MSPAMWLSWSLAALMVGTAGYHFVRLTTSGTGGEPDVDLTHLAMAAVMAFMLVGALTVPATRIWLVAFGAPTLWFGRRALQAFHRFGWQSAGPPMRQAVICVAMLFMLLRAGSMSAGTGFSGQMAGMAMPGAGESPGMAVGGIATVMLLIAVIGDGVWSVLTSRPGGVRGGCASPTAGGVALGCQLAMQATTAYMLVVML